MNGRMLKSDGEYNLEWFLRSGFFSDHSHVDIGYVRRYKESVGFAWIKDKMWILVGFEI